MAVFKVDKLSFSWHLYNQRGNNSVVECNLPKVEVASSNLVSRSNKIKDLGFIA